VIVSFKNIFLLSLLVMLFSRSSAQTTVPDSLRSSPDSLASTAPDSAKQRPAKGELDAPIVYDAHLIDNYVQERITILIGEAVVKYKNMTLEAGKITVDWDRHLLTAEPLPDSLAPSDSLADRKSTNDAKSDSANGKIDLGLPVFSDGSDRMTGEKMEFNFQTEKGRVLRGRTEFEDGKYSGRQIKRLAGNTLNVSHGVFTTCDLPEDPHFHFSSRKMKIIVNDKVIARPIVMYIGKIPLAILPFGVFPTRPGRHSGLIVPRFGASADEGRYFRELGYYWAASEYWDARMTLDYYDRSGWLAKAGIDYAWRYHFSGAISGSLTRRNFISGRNERRWDLALRHSQTLGSTASLNASGYFVSDNSFYKDFSFNQNQRLTRNLRSNATFSKNWPEAKSNVSINVSDTRDLDTGSQQRLLPQVSFYYGQRQLFGGGATSTKPGARRNEERRWYHNIYFGFSSNASHTQTKNVRRITADSSVTTEDTKTQASHRFDLRLNSPKQYFGWLYLSQGVNFSEDWFDRVTDYAQKSDSTRAITSRVDRGFAARHTFSYSASASTKIYGTFAPRLGPIKALRHVASPSLSFSYQPDFSEPKWGYYEEFVTATGAIDRRDRFGGTPRGKSASMSASLNNLFQMKTGPDEKEKKIDLFYLNFFTNYNFAAKEFALGDLNTSFSANPSQNVNLSMGATHSFYVFDLAKNQRVNRLLYKEHGLFSPEALRLTNFRFDASLRLEGKGRKLAQTGASETAISEQEEDDLQTDDGGVRNRFEADENSGDTGIPWRASFSFSYNLSKFNPANPTKTIYLTLSNAEVNLTQNWRVGMSAHMNLRTRQVVSQSYTFYRDLHCWELELRWTPSGPYEGFYFRINIKSPTLHDVKYEHRGGRSTVFGGIY
jgi:hypothetical protein